MSFSDSTNATRGKHRGKKRFDQAKADLETAVGPAIAQKIWGGLASAFAEAALLAEWKDRRAVIDSLIGLIQEAAISDEEALTDDMPF